MFAALLLAVAPMAHAGRWEEVCGANESDSSLGFLLAGSEPRVQVLCLTTLSADEAPWLDLSQAYEPDLRVEIWSRGETPGWNQRAVWQGQLDVEGADLLRRAAWGHLSTPRVLGIPLAAGVGVARIEEGRATIDGDQEMPSGFGFPGVPLVQLSNDCAVRLVGIVPQKSAKLVADCRERTWELAEASELALLAGGVGPSGQIVTWAEGGVARLAILTNSEWRFVTPDIVGSPYAAAIGEGKVWMFTTNGDKTGVWLVDDHGSAKRYVDVDGTVVATVDSANPLLLVMRPNGRRIDVLDVSPSDATRLAHLHIPKRRAPVSAALSDTVGLCVTVVDRAATHPTSPRSTYLSCIPSDHLRGRNN